MTPPTTAPLRGNRMSGGVKPCICGAATYRPRTMTARRMPRRCDDCHAIVGRCRCPVSLTVHLCPPEGSGTMPCCGASPFERTGDRMTLDPRRVTCAIKGEPT